ncbi:MAG: hypothetical protein HFE76_07965 [Firmicutes bacterium]|nr:hypothetical protein [Bacillota bacterium]
MVQDEIFNSDVIFMGTRVVPIGELKNVFPEWNESLKETYKENLPRQYHYTTDFNYGISATLNAVYTIDFERAQASYLCSFEEKKHTGDLYHPPIRIGNELFFAPSGAKKWAFYNLNTGLWSYEDIPEKLTKGEGPFIRFWAIVNDMLLYLSGRTDYLISVDLKTKKIAYHDCLGEMFGIDEQRPFFSSIIEFRNSILLFSGLDNHVYKLDTDHWKLIKLTRLDSGDSGIKTAFFVPNTDYIFLIKNDTGKGMGNRAIRWNTKTGHTEEVSCSDRSTRDSLFGDLMGGFCFYNDSLYITSQKEACIIELDWERNQARRIQLKSDFNLLDRKDKFYRRWGDGLAYTVIAYGWPRRKFTIFLPYDYSIADIDFEKGELTNKRKWTVQGSENLIKQSLKLKSNGAYIENPFFSVKEFLSEIVGK